jgi:hypothetical protein
VSEWHEGPRVTQRVRSLDLTTHASLSPIRRGFVPGFVNYKKGAPFICKCCRFLIISRFVEAILFPWINIVNLRIKILNNSVILSLWLGELKKGETFANFLNIEGGDNAYKTWSLTHHCNSKYRKSSQYLKA